MSWRRELRLSDPSLLVQGSPLTAPGEVRVVWGGGKTAETPS